MDDVATLAGVGRATVSRVLNDQANVSAKTRDRVMKAVAALDFRINPQARNLASQTTKALTLINCNSLDAEPNSYYFAALELGALRAAAQGGFELFTFNIYVEDRDRDDKVLEWFETGRSAGLILSPPLSADPALARRLIDAGCPTVCISPSAQVSALLPGVGLDEERAGYEVARHVIAAGHERLAYLLGIHGHLAAERRYAGALRAAEEAGLPGDAIAAARGDFTFRSGVELAEQLLEQRPRPTALICANDDMAVGALFAAHRMNLKVPEELSVTGFDDAPIAAHIWPPLTTIHQPIRRIAARAVERLTEALLRGRVPEPGPLELVGYQLVERASVAPPAL